MAPISYVRFSSGGTTLTIRTDKRATIPGSVDWAVLRGSNGLFTLGENDAQAVERTYSDGAVLPPRTRKIGREFTLEINVYGSDSKSRFNQLQSLLNSNRLTVSTDFPSTLTCQLQRLEIENHWFGNGPVIVTATFKAEQP